MLNLLGFAKPPNFLMFFKKLFGQVGNAKVEVCMRKKRTFESVKIFFFCKKKNELMSVDAFKVVYL